MIKLMDLLLEISTKPKAIFLAGPAGAGKTYISKQIIPPSLTVVNIDDTYEELLKATGLGTKISDFNQSQLSTAAKLMSQAKATTKEKYTQLSTGKHNIVIDGTGAASNPLLKKKQELESLGYDTMMLMVWVSPYTSLKYNASRERSLPPSILLKTWQSVNSNVDTYKEAFGDKFILINNDPNTKAEYNPDYVKRMFFDTVKGSGKEYTTDERAAKEKDIQALNNSIEMLIKTTPTFTTISDAKSKIQNFIK